MSLYTAEQLVSLCTDEQDYELDRGVLVPVSKSNRLHAFVVAFITAALFN